MSAEIRWRLTKPVSRHAATCAECRLLISELSSVVDDLLLLAPSHEPPPGFASRTLALGAGAVYQGTSGDRRLADSYRAVLAQGHGSFFAAAPLKSPTGTLGSVFGYQGQPSWLFATLSLPTARAERYEVQLITRDGRHLSLGGTVLGGTHRTWGAQIPVQLNQVSQLRFESASGQSTIIAYLNPRNPWSSG
jgi:hypothetical protein